eukprot:TRINITY_DN767_c0_g1_i1.p1 TRINITY_DN767_c0_g1~~TRINITY_DN767_c0_g1_i1.p1  ORF type:complete len:433 (-),score=147.53 TRINITY_DN767_c0_g1_i1:181-1479(-)
MHRLVNIQNHLINSQENNNNNLFINSTSNMSNNNNNNNVDDDIVIVGAKRTPMGSFNGALKSLTAPDLGAIAIKAALQQANVDPSLIDEVFMGNVLSANIGQAPAKQAAIKAGIPTSVPCTTVNKVCSSGMKAIMFGCQTIRLGYANIVVAGGMESMSNAPYYLSQARTGLRMGDSTLIDGMIKDGLWDPYNDCHMGIAAEQCSDDYTITRKEQDEHATNSFNRAKNAWENKQFSNEIVNVEVPQRRGDPVVVDYDEELTKINTSKIPNLRTVFKKNGTVTAANASSISDGAAVVILMKRSKAEELNLNILASIKGFGDAAQDPIKFTTSPSLAIPKALNDANLSIDDMDFFEINEAFSVVSVANTKILNIDPEKVNVYGGGVSIGHPIGCSGCRIIVTLISILQNNKSTYGCAGICNGGGGASAMIIKNES